MIKSTDLSTNQIDLFKDQLFWLIAVPTQVSPPPPPMWKRTKVGIFVHSLQHALIFLTQVNNILCLERYLNKYSKISESTATFKVLSSSDLKNSLIQMVKTCPKAKWPVIISCDQNILSLNHLNPIFGTLFLIVLFMLELFSREYCHPVCLSCN